MARQEKKATQDASSTVRQGTPPVDIAVKRIKEMIFHNEVVPGQKLICTDLAKKFNMSNTPIIQALNRLQLFGIVYSERS